MMDLTIKRNLKPILEMREEFKQLVDNNELVISEYIQWLEYTLSELFEDINY